MRLTPFRSHPSTDSPPDEPSIDVEIYYPSVNEASPGTSDGEPRSVDAILSADPTLEAVLEGLETSITVDELVDQLVDPRDWVSIELWGDVHERLYRIDLPELDEDGVIEFDPERGVVDVPEGT